MWLSNRDFCQLMERCLVADLPMPFAVVNGMSANTGMHGILNTPASWWATHHATM